MSHMTQVRNNQRTCEACEAIAPNRPVWAKMMYAAPNRAVQTDKKIRKSSLLEQREGG